MCVVSEFTIIALAATIAAILISLCVGITIHEERKKSKKPESAYLIHLMGTNFRNPDGALIQEVIGMMSEGDRVILHTGSHEGKKSVRVDSYYGTIGFLPRHYAYIVSELIKSGTLGEVTIDNIHPSRIGRSNGVTIKVCIDDKIKVDPSIF